MSAKEIHFAEESRAEIAKGVELLANTVRVTLGPRGRNVAINIRDQAGGDLPVFTD